MSVLKRIPSVRANVVRGLAVVLVAIAARGEIPAANASSTSPVPAAAPSSAGMVSSVRTPGSAKPPKAAPAPAPPAKAIPPCVLAAYAALDTEVTALATKHGAGTAAFRAAYAARKQALVGPAALAKAGCKAR